MPPVKSLLAALAALVLVAGCGGSGGKKGSVSITQSNNDCGFKQITAGARREGTCVARGVAITVVNKAHLLHGKQYDARILATRSARTVGRIKSHGTFEIVKLAVTNTLTTPQAFDRHSDLVFLLVDGKYFGERSDAEVQSLDPFRLRRGAIQPDGTATGTVVFDVPMQVQKDLTVMGSNLILVNYEDESKSFPNGSQPLRALGYIRLWK
jgi:Domain of unknown function (DUF4352)